MAGGVLQGPDFGESADDFSGYRPMAEINVTPLVDVMLVLLIIFMVAAPLMMVGVPLELPKAAAAKIEKTREPIVVSLDRDGRYFLGEDEVPEAQIIARLDGLRREDGELPIYVRGDKGIEYGQVMQLLGKIGQAGFAKVSLIAEAEGQAPSGVGTGRPSTAPSESAAPRGGRRHSRAFEGNTP
jgi:TolR protein